MRKLKQTLALFLVAVLFMWAVPLPGQSPVYRVYEEREGKKLTTHRFVINSVDSGFSIDLTSEIEGNKIDQTFQLDSDLDTLSWTYHAPHKKTKVKAVRKENRIFLEGTDEGDPIKKTFKINRLPWNQSFNIGLEKFALSSEKAMQFWAIGTTGPGNMKITKFNVKKKKTETITLNEPGTPGKQVEAVYLTISLSGILSLFWTGKYWYRKSDGWFLRYRGKNKAGGPIAVMQLIPGREK
jgi:hypothetical protein